MKEQLSATLENSKNYTLQVAAAMPANQYAFKPAATVWNFGELVQHIGYGIYWWEENYVRGTESEWNPPAAIIDKEELVSYLTGAFEMLGKSLASSDLKAKALYGFHATLDHITHHRGQATTYLRCCDIVPPEYVY